MYTTRVHLTPKDDVFNSASTGFKEKKANLLCRIEFPFSRKPSLREVRPRGIARECN